MWVKVLRTVFQLHSGLVAQCWPEWTLKGLSACTKNYAELRTWSRGVNVNFETGGVYTLNELKGK